MREWSQQERLAGTLVALAVVLAIFLLVPPFLVGDAGFAAGFTWQEAADLFTPIVAMPLFALAIELAGRHELRIRLVLVVLIAAWVEGHGIHLAANSIGDVFRAGAERQAFYGSASGPLDHFLDEGLGHWLWHGAWLGLLLLLLFASATGPTERRTASPLALGVAATGGVIQGVVWFVVTDEGGTWALAIPGAALLLVLAILVRWRAGAWRVTTAFLAVAASLPLVLYAIWIALHGWPPVGFCDLIGC